jgi:cathepsin L
MKSLLLVVCILVVATNAVSDHTLWTEFKAKYDRQYKHVEDKLRFQVFQDNLQLINEHNDRYAKGEVSYFLKVTKFADWTKEEFSNLLKKQAATKPELTEGNIFKADPNVKLPDSVDWREKGAVLGVRNQGDCGSCWSFSTTGCIEGQLILRMNKSVALSVQELVDCSQEYGNMGCEGGDQFISFQYIKSNGISSEEDYPYLGYLGVCQEKTFFIPTLGDLFRVSPDEDSLIQAIAEVGPIAASADAIPWAFYGGGIFDDSTCTDEVNHAILAVGYAADYTIIKNSWGEDWGENGYIRLVRGKNICNIDTDNSFAFLERLR